MKEFQVSLNGKVIEGKFRKYESRKVEKMAETKEYPPAIFMRVSKAGTSLYGFTPDEGVEGGKSLVMNRADLIKLLKGEVEYVKVGILSPSAKSEPEDDTEGL